MAEALLGAEIEGEGRNAESQRFLILPGDSSAAKHIVKKDVIVL